MAGVSEDLRRERERLEVSLETISEVTRISLRHLRALEAGEIEQLPGGVFRHGIVRNYLSVLGLDAAPWIERFDAEQEEMAGGDVATEPTAALAEFAENVHRARPHTPPARDFRWFGVVLMVCLLMALGWSVWRYVMHGHVVLSTQVTACRGAVRASRGLSWG